MEVREQTRGAKRTNKFEEKTVLTGETGRFELTGLSLTSGDKVAVVPIILGEAGEETVRYTCGDDYEEIVTVI